MREALGQVEADPLGLFDIMDLLTSYTIMVIEEVDQHIGRLGDGRERVAIELLVTRPYRCRPQSNKRRARGA